MLKYAALFSLICFAFILGMVYLRRRKIHLELVAKKNVGEKDFLSVRVEQNDFLFLRTKDRVNFIESLDDVDDFVEVPLNKDKETLSIPDHEKAS